MRFESRGHPVHYSSSCFLLDWSEVQHSAACQREPFLTLTSPFRPSFPVCFFSSTVEWLVKCFDTDRAARRRPEMCNLIMSRWGMGTFAKRGHLKGYNFYQGKAEIVQWKSTIDFNLLQSHTNTTSRSTLVIEMSQCLCLVLGIQKLLLPNAEVDKVVAAGQRTHEVLKRCHAS